MSWTIRIHIQNSASWIWTTNRTEDSSLRAQQRDPHLSHASNHCRSHIHSSASLYQIQQTCSTYLLILSPPLKWRLQQGSMPQMLPQHSANNWWTLCPWSRTQLVVSLAKSKSPWLVVRLARAPKVMDQRNTIERAQRRVMNVEGRNQLRPWCQTSAQYHRLFSTSI